MKKTKAKNSDDVLRLDNNSILKEIGRMGPCDGSTGCYYCRDWSLLVYKKQLMGKQQQQLDKSIDPNQFLVKAGAFSIAINHSDRPDTFQKSKIPEGSYDRDSTISPLKSYAAACTEWMKIPSQHTLPGYLLPLEFDTSLSAYDTSSGNDKDNDEDDTNKLLQHLVCDRQGIALAPEQLELLINVDKVPHSDAVVSGCRPPCCEVEHFAGCTSPNDLEMERAIVNESMAKCVKKESVILEEQLKTCWNALVEFMTKADVVEREFDCLVGSGLNNVIGDFMKQHDKSIVVPFQDFWTPLVPGFKKKTPKKSDGVDMLTTVDNTFINYMDQILKATEDFYMTFVSSTIVAKLQQFKTSVETILTATETTLEGRYETTKFFFHKIQERIDTTKKQLMEADTAKKRLVELKKKAASSSSPSSFDDDLHKLQHDVAYLRGMLEGSVSSTLHQTMSVIPELCKNHDIIKMLKGHAAIINLTIEALQSYANEKWNEEKAEIEQLKHIYLKESLPNVASRVEKVAHKEFRKKVKKIEQRYGSMRQGLRYMLHCSLVKVNFNDDVSKSKAEVLDDSSSFYNVMIRTMEALLREGEIAEAIIINGRGIQLENEHEELIYKRAQLQDSFTFGIANGQHELATVIKILVMAESKRLLSENEAIQREISLTKSIGSSSARAKTKLTHGTNTSSPLLTALTALSCNSTGTRKKTKKTKSSTLAATTGIESAIDQQTPDHTLKGKIPATTSNVPAKDAGLSPNSDEKKIQKKEQPHIETAKQGKPVKTSTDASASIPLKKDTSETGAEKLLPPPGLSKQNQPTKLKAAANSPLAHNNQFDAKKNKVLPPGLTTKTTASASISDTNRFEIKTETVPPPVASTEPVVEQDQRNFKKEKAHSPGTVKSHQLTATPKTEPPTAPEKQETGAKTEKIHSFSRKRHQQANDGKRIGDNTVVEKKQIDSWNTPPTISSSSQPSWGQPIDSKSEQQVTWNTPPPFSSAPFSANATWNETVSSNQPSATSSTTWSQTVAASKPPGSSSAANSAKGQFSVQQTDSQTTSQKVTASSGWGEPPVQQTDSWNTPPTLVENSGWGQPATSTTARAIEKKGWSDNWTAKAQGMANTLRSGGDKNANNLPNDDLHEPKQVNVSLKDILVKTQEIPMTSNISQLSASSPVTVAPPPALGCTTPPTPPTTTNINQLYHLNQESLINIITSLRCENQQLQQSMMSMQQALSMTMTLAKEREEQTLELFNARKQADLEEARVYILSLESKIKELEMQSRAPPSTTNAFVNQDLFADYRQEFRADSSESHQQHYNNGGNYQRRLGKKYWQKKPVVKCSNCGEADHTSSDCKDSCRYCGSLDHLSENCAQAW